MSTPTEAPGLWFVMATLGVWRVTHLVNAEDGPWAILARLRGWAGHGGLGQLLDCFKCLSLWVAAPWAVALANGWTQGVMIWLALSGGAILLEDLAARHAGTPPAAYVEGDSDVEEDDDGLLRR